MAKKEEKLYCSMCHKKLDASEFTTWSRNPALADRNNKVVICKNCCSDYVESNGP
jgi:uncharacterized CHY-type Zn-finger protein